jgi:hypothetical protein
MTSAKGPDRAAGVDSTAAGHRFKTVTRTFANPLGIVIPPQGPAGPYPATILVGGLRHGHLKDVDLQLHGLDHTFPDDLDVLLVAPNGRNAVVLSDVGGDVDVGGGFTLTLDDEATSSVPDSGPLSAGAFQPTNIGATDTFPAPAPAPSGQTALSAFDGSSPNGTWQLYVLDDQSGDSGLLLGGWSLRITARVRT